MRREIPVQEWPSFLERLGRERRAWLCTMDYAGSVQAREQPLESISIGEGVDIRLGGRVVHLDAPQAVHVEHTGKGALKLVQIEDNVGRTLTLRISEKQIRRSS
jgi:hypothetical protein